MDLNPHQSCTTSNFEGNCHVQEALNFHHTFGWEFREAETEGEAEDLAGAQNQWDEPWDDQWHCVQDATAWPTKYKSIWLQLPVYLSNTYNTKLGRVED